MWATKSSLLIGDFNFHNDDTIDRSPCIFMTWDNKIPVDLEF